MRYLVTLTAVLTITLVPGILLAGDKIHHGHGMRSGWDSQTGSGPQGSEWVGEIPDFYRVNPYRYHRRGHYPGYPAYGWSGLSVNYNDGNWGATFTYGNQRSGWYGYPGYYQPVYAQPYPYAYGYPQQPAYYYSSPNYQRYPSPPIWSAPADPQLGYYAQPSQNYQQQPQVVNIYNYYSSEFQQQPEAAPRQAQPAVPQAAPPQLPQPSVETAPLEVPVGTRFYSSARLSAGTSTMNFSLDGQKLYAGPENGPPQLVAANVDGATGVLAAYQPGWGYSLIYRTGDAIVAAWTNGEAWFEEPLPQYVDFSGDLTIGMVGGSPWVVFSGMDGRRHVFSYGDGWLELGSASAPADSD